MPIDNHSHTVLHWAAALSRLQLLQALITAGASPFRINASGHTALMRADLYSFAELFFEQTDKGFPKPKSCL